MAKKIQEDKSKKKPTSKASTKRKADKQSAKKVCKSGRNRKKDDKKSSILPSKINWKELKQEYIDSDYIVVNDFLRNKEILKDKEQPNGTIGRQIGNWKPEKLKILEERADQQAQLKRELYAIENKQVLTSALHKKIRILNAIDKRLDLLDARTGFGNFVVSTKDLVIMLQAVKTELGEPIKILKNQNENLDVNVLLEQIRKTDEPIDQRKLQRELYGDRELIEVEIDGYKC